MTILRHLSADKKILLKQHKILRHTIECGISNVGTLHVAVILDMLRRKRGSEVGNKLWLGLLIAAYALPLSAGIYMGTDATPPATYQSDSNYPANVVAANNTAGQRNCRLYYDGKGPVPPLTCSPVTTPSVAASAPTVKTTTAPTPIVPIKNDQAAKQQPLAHVDTTTDNTGSLTSPATTAVVAPAVKPAPTPAVQPGPTAAVKPAPTPAVQPGPTPAVKPAPTPAVKPALTPAVKSEPTPVAKPVSPPPKPLFTAVAMPGSLKANVERIVAQSHWGTVVWNLPIDYNWEGTMTITAPDVQGALSQLLAQYPVQAIFYDKNHIVSIEARRAI